MSNLLDILVLRLPDNVLWECRRVGEELKKLFIEYFPTIMHTWEEEVLNTVTLSKSEILALRPVIDLIMESDVSPAVANIFKKLMSI